MLGVLVFVVVVLGFLFNLVSILFVSIIAGMMAGASRRFNWQVICVSLIPPIVALGLGYVTKVGFDLQKWFSLTGICLGSFWGTWLATYLLMFLEKKNDATPSPVTGNPSAASPAAARSPVAGEARQANETNGQFDLRHLEGTWFSEMAHRGELPNRKELVFTKDSFRLCIINTFGHARMVAQGEVSVHSDHDRTDLVIRGTSTDEEYEI